MKYIIEIEDEPFGRNDDPVIPHGMDELYRAKGFNSLVFDKNGLDKLTPLDKELEEAYEKGLNDAWKAITKIAKMPDGEREKVFGDWWISNILNKFSAHEIINILDGYEPEQDEIKVGDEVTPKSNDSNWLGVVVGVDDTNAMVMTKDGYTAMYRFEILKKTDRHFPQAVELLNAMKEVTE